MDAIGSQPSARRDSYVRETVDGQQSRLATMIADACKENHAGLALADRVAELSPDFRVAIFEVAEQVWAKTEDCQTWEEKLLRLGIQPLQSSGSRLEALQFRERHDRDSGADPPSHQTAPAE